MFHRKKKIKDEDVKKLRLAALLHDVGHYPYSHLMEYIESEQKSEQYLQKKNGTVHFHKKVKLYPSHETLSKIIVTKRKDIVDLLKQAKIDPNEIAALMEGEHSNIPNILHKSLDVDRLDYLVRDSYNTGLPYGRVDLNYILGNLDVSDEHEIVLRKKARLSAEHLLLARYFMFNAVYCHKTIYGFEELVRNTIKLIIENEDGKIYSKGSAIEEMIKDNSHVFLYFDDSYLDKVFDGYASSKKEDILCRFCRNIKHRRPPKLVHEEIELKDGNSTTTSFRIFLRKELIRTAKSCHINPKFLFWGETKDVRFEAMNPFVSLSKLKDLKEEELRELVKINDNGNIVNLIEDGNSIIHHLSGLTNKSIRLYAIDTEENKVDKLKEKITEYCTT